MTTTKVSMTTDKSAPPADYADAIGNAVLNKQAGNGFTSTLRSLPGRARAWASGVMRTFHLDGAGQAAGDGAKWLWARAQRGMRFVRRLNLFYIGGTIATVPAGRNAVVNVAAAAYKVVRKPFEWAHRGLSWLCRKTGFTWGEKVLAQGAERGQRLEAWVANKVDQGLDWMDSQDQHPAMRVIRGGFQFLLIRRVIGMIVPTAPTWLREGISGAVPVVGDRTLMAEAIEAEEAAIDKAKQALADKPETTVVVEPAAKPKPKPTKATADAKAPSVTLKTVVMTDSSLPADKATFEVIAEVNEEGVTRYRLGSQLLMIEDLPASLAIVGEHIGEDQSLLLPHPNPAALEKTVRESQATPSGRPPSLPRAARRAAARGKAGQPAKT